MFTSQAEEGLQEIFALYFGLIWRHRLTRTTANRWCKPSIPSILKIDQSIPSILKIHQKGDLNLIFLKSTKFPLRSRQSLFPVLKLAVWEIQKCMTLRLRLEGQVVKFIDITNFFSYTYYTDHKNGYSRPESRNLD